jgi:hypothetical protein
MTGVPGAGFLHSLIIKGIIQAARGLEQQTVLTGAEAFSAVFKAAAGGRAGPVFPERPALVRGAGRPHFGPGLKGFGL